MSASTLREAAAAIRDEWDDQGGPHPMGTAWHQERDFHLATATWLDREADCEHPHAWDAHRLDAALAVARAYLGESHSARLRAVSTPPTAGPPGG